MRRERSFYDFSCTPADLRDLVLHTRASLGMTKAEFARTIGVRDAKTISMWENGEGLEEHAACFRAVLLGWQLVRKLPPA